jgi:hypothetical protein
MAAILRRRGQAPGSPRPLPPVPCALQCRVRRELRRYDLSARVGEIAAPALLLVGSEDPYRRDMEWWLAACRFSDRRAGRSLDQIPRRSALMHVRARNSAD